MGTVDEIRAAIDELTQLRDAATPGQRGFSANWFDGSQQSLVAVEHGMDGDFRSAGRIANFDGPHLMRARDDGLLIAALHRTIDAQLVLLQESLDFYENSQAIGMPEIEMSEYYGATLALARAINGLGD